MNINAFKLSPTLMELSEKIEGYIDEPPQPRPQTEKENSLNKPAYLYPVVPIEESRYLLHHCTTLRKIVQILSQDVVLNKYSLTDSLEDDTLIEHIWNDKTQVWQLYNCLKDYYTYGYGALEVIPAIDGDPAGITFKQIPATTIKLYCNYLLDTNGQYHSFYYLEQQQNQSKVSLRLTSQDYSFIDDNNFDETVDESTGYCIWIGGDEERDFFSLPFWVTCRDSIFTSLGIDELNFKRIRNGGIPSGVMVFTGPPEKLKQGTDRTEHKVKQELRESNGATAFLYLENNSSQQKPVEMQYQQLSSTNFDELDALQEKCDKCIRDAGGVPKIRMMIDDTTESMNSNKSDTIYEIYNRTIMGEQYVSRQLIDNFNHHYLKRVIKAFNKDKDEEEMYSYIVSDISISCPEFVDKTNTRVNTVIELFNNAQLTLQQCLDQLVMVYPDIDFTDVQDNSYLLNSRYYNGKLLGSPDDELDQQDMYNQLLDQVNQVLDDSDSDELLKTSDIPIVDDGISAVSNEESEYT